MTADNRVVAQYLAAALVWGSSFLFMKVGLEGLSPVQVALSRLLLGALTLVVVMTVARRTWPRDVRTWGHLTVLGLLLCMAPYVLFAWAGQHLASGLSSIFNATTPLMTAVAVAVLLPVERLTAAQRVGLAVGAVGVVVVVGPWAYLRDVTSAAPLPAVLACLGATACYGLGTTYQRRFVVPLRLPPETVAAGQVGAGALLLAFASPLVATGPVDLTWRVVLSMVALGALGTGLAYVWMARIIDSWGPQRASTVTYLTPVVGVVLGILVLGEQLQWYEPVGGLVVVLGVVVAQRGGRRTAPTPPGPSPGAAVTTVTAHDEGTDLDARPT